jgi:hypothetical protein
VYLTANPHARDLPSGTFHAHINTLDDAWDDESGTVLPEDMTERAIEIHDQYPSKKVIVHYMQPHFPFLGPAAQDIPQERLKDEDRDIPNPWYGLAWHQEFSRDQVIQAYHDTFDRVWKSLYPLLNSINGKVVVSADHGNLIGERTRPIPIRTFGHPPNVYHPNLITVPWLEIGTGRRRDVVAESPVGDEGDFDDVENRLKSLGYR